jgi:glycine/D-amino acid oxidase-like deaminating enzyme/nitrite reductase/ring-hydroxylating ferredoxin subunit
MKNDSGTTVSPWMHADESPTTHSLLPQGTVDVCVIGAGISGMSVAYMLARQGRTVVVLDDGAPGGGETCRTSAHLSSAIDDGFLRVEQLHGADAARLAYASHAEAIDRIEAIVREEGIECDFQRVDGYLLQAPNSSAVDLALEFEAAARAGARVESLAEAPFAGMPQGPCLRFPNQAQLHPLRYLRGLSEAFLRLGGHIHRDVHALKVRDGEPVTIELESGRALSAATVVVATNSPFTTLVAMHTKLAPYRSFVIAAECARGSMPNALLWDTAQPYHYVRVVAAESEDELDLLLVGGEDHKTGQADDAPLRFERLENWMRQHFPEAQLVRHRWSGQVMETLDGLAYIGKEPGAEHIYLATGDSGMGLTHGTIAGMLLSELIEGREHPWTVLYAPDRKPLRAAGVYLRENLNVAAQFVDHVKPSEIGDPALIERECGAVLRRGAQLVAAYRDAQGELQELSAICTHLGGVVRFNSAEKTWDCPCHGSRFDLAGRVINAPASRALAPLKRVEPEPVQIRAES